MTKAAIEIISELLDHILGSPSKLAAVLAYQNYFWENQLDLEKLLASEVYDMLADLAYDLDYFEPDPIDRMADPAYYGNERLSHDIMIVLQRLRP